MTGVASVTNESERIPMLEKLPMPLVHDTPVVEVRIIIKISDKDDASPESRYPELVWWRRPGTSRSVSKLHNKHMHHAYGF